MLEAKLPAYLPKDKGSQSTPEDPVEQLSVQIVCDFWGTEVPRRGEGLVDESGKKKAFALQGHRIHWQVGPKRFDELTELVTTLEKIAKDPTKRVPDKKNPGTTKLMAVVIEPGPKSTYGDVAQTVDAVTKSGFEEINFGGGLGRKEATPARGPR
jgi:hypothetical protein